MRVARNDPCPCGSGKKYKKCCGSVISLNAVAARQCGTCTACCDGWVVGTIYGHEMKPGKPCHFRGQGCCTIYETRPVDPCRKFVCGWLLPDSPFPESFRPDRLGVMIVPTRWRQRPAFILRSAGRDPDEELLAWMRGLSARTSAPFFYEQNGERFGFGPPEFQQEMLAKLENGERLW
jgi:SEC-C motif-containing protein